MTKTTNELATEHSEHTRLCERSDALLVGLYGVLEYVVDRPSRLKSVNKRLGRSFMRLVTQHHLFVNGNPHDIAAAAHNYAFAVWEFAPLLGQDRCLTRWQESLQLARTFHALADDLLKYHDVHGYLLDEEGEEAA